MSMSKYGFLPELVVPDGQLDRWTAKRCGRFDFVAWTEVDDNPTEGWLAAKESDPDLEFVILHLDVFYGGEPMPGVTVTPVKAITETIPLSRRDNLMLSEVPDLLRKAIGLLAFMQRQTANLLEELALETLPHHWHILQSQTE